eukprot:9482709-Pyramimonas_sp.AAC.1
MRRRSRPWGPGREDWHSLQRKRPESQVTLAPREWATQAGAESRARGSSEASQGGATPRAGRQRLGLDRLVSSGEEVGSGQPRHHLPPGPRTRRSARA